MMVGGDLGCYLRYLVHWGPGTDDRAQTLGPVLGKYGFNNITFVKFIHATISSSGLFLFVAI